MSLLFSGDDLVLGNLTFPVGSTINEEVCGNVTEVVDDTLLESEEVFSIFVSDILTLLEDGDMVDFMNISLSVTFPCDNLTTTISTSDTDGW